MNGTAVSNEKNRKKSIILNKKTKRLIFYCSIMAWPVIQVALFYVYVNINTVMLTFQKFNSETGKYVFGGLANFKRLFHSLKNDPSYGTAFKNSFLSYIVPLFISLPLGQFVSYYIYKRGFLSKTFKLLLFLPSIISSLALVIVATYVLELLLPELVYKIGLSKTIHTGYLLGTDLGIWILVIYNLWIGFGGGVLLWPATMASAGASQIESAELDGCGELRVYLHVILPHIWLTWVTMFVAGMCGMLTGDPGVYAFFGRAADPRFKTVGYLLTMMTIDSTYLTYPDLATFGLFLTILLAPTVLVIRKLLEKYGPRPD